MNIKSALTGNKLARHYGLNDGDKLSGSGCLNFTYQLLAMVLATAVVIFTGTEAITAAGFAMKALATVITALAFFAGAKLLIRLADAGIKRIGQSVSNRALHFVVTLALMLAFLAAIMSWPAVFLFALSKLMPSVVGFAGWGSAFTAGFGVLCADTILGGLTGVSLLAGKREKPISMAGGS